MESQPNFNETVDQEYVGVEGHTPADSKGIITYDLPKIDLPPKEAATVRYIALGRTHKSIAEEFNISTAAVDQRRKRAMQRLGIRTSAGLMHYAIMASLCELGEAQ